jgi:hypothetical protein
MWFMGAAAMCLVVCWSFFARGTMLVERRSSSEYPGSAFKPRYPAWWRFVGTLGWVFFILGLIAHVLGI